VTVIATFSREETIPRKKKKNRDKKVTNGREMSQRLSSGQGLCLRLEWNGWSKATS